MQPQNKIIEYLLDAHSKETALVQTLTLHTKIAAPGSYKKLLEDHRKETVQHAKLLQERLVELGGHKKPLAVGYAAAQNILTNSLAMAKAPVDMLRGKSQGEKMLKNARDEAMTEAAEIACYDTIEHLCTKLGDDKTAELARRIRRDEERMLDALRAEIPSLTDSVIEVQIPDATEPWRGYDAATAAEINKRLARATEDELERVRTYEAAHKNRKSILRNAERQTANA